MKLLPYLAVLASFAAGMWQKWPCHSAGWPYLRQLIFGELCYSDLPVLYVGRELSTGQFPYAGSFEYPVILGYVAGATASITSTPSGFYLLNLCVLLACTMVTVWATIRLTGRMLAGLIVAVSPVLALTGTINWDMIPVMLVALAMLAWAKERPALAGLAIGLGTATKLYPILLLFPLLLLAFHIPRWRPFGSTAEVPLGSPAMGGSAWWLAAGVAGVTWLAVNLPVLVFYPAGWSVFWKLNADRPADFGSVWYALGVDTPLNGVTTVLFGLCLLGIGLLAPRRLEVLTLLTVTAFLVTNKVYSPQYVLWLLPLAVVAGAPLIALALWQAAEVAYWWAVWQHLMGTISFDRYSTIVFIRIGAEILLCMTVLMSVLDKNRPFGCCGGERPIAECDGDRFGIRSQRNSGGATTGDRGQLWPESA